MRKIILAESAGFCFGVKRAVDRAFELLKQGGPIACLGSLIHNPDVVARLEQSGLRVVESEDEINPGERVIIRTHGVGSAVMEALRAKKAGIIDMTCPLVKNIHNIVTQKSREGFLCVIVGDAGHPEVRGIAGWCENALVTVSPYEIEEYFSQNIPSGPVCVVSQTTMDRTVFEQCAERVKKLCTNAEIFDTICEAMSEKQREAESISRKSDMMIIIGGFESSNTKRLRDICREGCKNVLHIERAGQIEHIPPEAGVIGITAGTSTPMWIIKEVVSKMSEEQNGNNIPGESFAEMLEQSIKTLNTRDRVTGIITGITSTEIQVDLGTKHAGYIPASEYSDNIGADPFAGLKVGDEIECIVTRVNDVEGTAQLSKKQLDAVKNWSIIEEACENSAVLEGVVVEDNRGGIVVSVMGVRVFVPMSQTGLPKDTPASSMIKSTVRLRITEINRPRRRVIGSVRAVISEERRIASEKIWADIQPGVRYNGIVKSITNYGVFVDIGGVDGMVHVSELSWSRIRHPSDVAKVGDEIDVYVISADPEKRKISLGHRRAEDNPWQKFVESYKKDDIVTVTIAKLMPFGAFAEIIPGIDGLIHISQIADRRIARPGEVLSEGQQVDALITDIDLENKKISLSIRALGGDSEGEYTPAESAAVEETDGVVEPAVVEQPAEVEESAEADQPTGEPEEE